ncbi:MAG: methyltransferase domain-containing protein [Acetobacteraceae bacterium]|nr:methyltransferase domain-containing protein [Acetobacteraceae bacterium]
MRLADRLAALWDHLGLSAAHVATQMPVDVADFAAGHPERIAGLVFCAPSRLNADSFVALESRLSLISGDRGPLAELVARTKHRLPSAQHRALAEYEALGWSDIIADHGARVTDIMRAFLTQPASPPRNAATSGTHAGITYHIQGQGPALVLLPFMLAPSQWDPALADLARDFTVIVLGGPHIGGVAALEDRAQSPSYQGMVRTLFDIIAPRAGETILDVGCGSGALDRLLAQRYGAQNPITATDVNPFLLREATALADTAGLRARIAFRPANAEALPFADQHFDCIYSVTVLEECDADKALAEFFRVLRPGGRAGIIVRAIDMPQWWHLRLSDDVRRKVTAPPQSISAHGVADASLYLRMRAAGFTGLTCFPSLVTLDHPEGPIWRYREDHALSMLTKPEVISWRAMAAAAQDEGMLFMAHPLHCVVGQKPA